MKRRKPSLEKILSPGQVEEICTKASPRDACLVALLYLTGRRINEVLPLRAQDFSIVENRVIFKTLNLKSFRKEKRTPFTISYNGKWYEEILPMFSFTGPSGEALGKYVLNYLGQLRPDEFLFAPERASRSKYINRFRAYQIIRALDNGLWLHLFRHMAFTRFARVYRDNPVAMHRITFHRKFESTLNYIQTLSAEDRLDKV